MVAGGAHRLGSGCRQRRRRQRRVRSGSACSRTKPRDPLRHHQHCAEQRPLTRQVVYVVDGQLLRARPGQQRQVLLLQRAGSLLQCVCKVLAAMMFQPWLVVHRGSSGCTHQPVAIGRGARSLCVAPPNMRCAGGRETAACRATWQSGGWLAPWCATPILRVSVMWLHSSSTKDPNAGISHFDCLQNQHQCYLRQMAGGAHNPASSTPQHSSAALPSQDNEQD